MKLTTTLKHTESSLLWNYYLEIPAETAKTFTIGSDRRVICTFDNGQSIHTSLMPSGAHHFIMINRQLREQLHLKVNDNVTINLEKDHSPYGMPMPEELEALLQQDAEGSDYFHALTPGKQRTLIHLVSKVKNIDSRINKGLAILFHLKEESGELDFKRLNQLIKEYNHRSKLS